MNRIADHPSKTKLGPNLLPTGFLALSAIACVANGEITVPLSSWCPLVEAANVVIVYPDVFASGPFVAILQLSILFWLALDQLLKGTLVRCLRFGCVIYIPMPLHVTLSSHQDNLEWSCINNGECRSNGNRELHRYTGKSRLGTKGSKLKQHPS